MRLAEPGFLAAGIGEILLVLLEKRLQDRAGGEIDLPTDTPNIDRHDLRRGRLRQPPEVVPAEAGGIAEQPTLEEQEHVLGEQFLPQRLEQIVLRDPAPAGPEPPHDLLELIGTDLPVGFFGEEVVDRRVADDDPVLLRLLRQEHRRHDRPLVDVEPTRLGRVAAGSHRRLLEEAIDDKLHHHGPVQPLLPDFAPVPGGHRRIGQGGGLPAILEQRGEDEERQHGEDGEGHHRGLLIGAEDAEASHGAA